MTFEQWWDSRRTGRVPMPVARMAWDAAVSQMAALRAALESIAASTCCGDCQEAARVAKKALSVAPASASANTQSAAIAQIVADMRRELRDAVTFGGVICDGDVRRWMRQLRAL